MDSDDVKIRQVKFLWSQWRKTKKPPGVGRLSVFLPKKRLAIRS